MKMWIARSRFQEDGYSFLTLHEYEPKYDEGDNLWYDVTGYPTYLDNRNFPEVTFENSLVEVELLRIYPF